MGGSKRRRFVCGFSWCHSWAHKSLSPVEGELNPAFKQKRRRFFCLCSFLIASAQNNFLRQRGIFWGDISWFPSGVGGWEMAHLGASYWKQRPGDATCPAWSPLQPTCCHLVWNDGQVSLPGVCGAARLLVFGPEIACCCWGLFLVNWQFQIAVVLNTHFEMYERQKENPGNSVPCRCSSPEVPRQFAFFFAIFQSPLRHLTELCLASSSPRPCPWDTPASLLQPGNTPGYQNNLLLLFTKNR